MKRNRKLILISAGLFISFIIWTLLISFIDVKSIGPNNSVVGFSTLNSAVHNALGVNLNLYYITDWLSLIPVFIILIFACMGLYQLIKRKSLFKVDFDLLISGLFYIALFLIYILL